ncbi:unnamed protein product [Meloidogyne enterolobii]|uniref:Uncharacterized protein n=1 Tax=Meloidogyne enterolobii TaxID=390850 RepID=A0ACB0ZTH4_MELEN
MFSMYSKDFWFYTFHFYLSNKAWQPCLQCYNNALYMQYSQFSRHLNTFHILVLLIKNNNGTLRLYTPTSANVCPHFFPFPSPSFSSHKDDKWSSINKPPFSLSSPSLLLSF